jgi:preflagellin peptidase FlaK
MPPVPIIALVGLLAILLAGPAITDLLTRRVDRRVWPSVTAAALLLSLVHLGWIGTVAPRAVWAVAGQQGALALTLGLAGRWAHRRGWLGGADWKLLGLLPLCLPPGLRVAPAVALWPPALVPALSALALASLVALAHQLLRWVTHRPRGLRPLQLRVRPLRLRWHHGQIAAGPQPGLDLDTLRMYLRWRGATLCTLRAATTDPAAACGIHLTRRPTDGGVVHPPRARPRLRRLPADDRWGAAAFLADAPRDAYGATAMQLRQTLDFLMLVDAVQVRVGQPLITHLYLAGATLLVVGDPIAAVAWSMG